MLKIKESKKNIEYYKKRITKKSRNSKLKEKYYIDKKNHLATEKKFVLHHSLKTNKRGVLIKNRKINKRPHHFLGT